MVAYIRKHAPDTDIQDPTKVRVTVPTLFSVTDAHAINRQAQRYTFRVADVRKPSLSSSATSAANAVLPLSSAPFGPFSFLRT